MLPVETNLTPFPVAVTGFLDAQARPHCLVVLSATFATDAHGAIGIAELQSPVQDVDGHYGEADASSLRYDTDFAWEKPAVDIVVNGTAYAPASRAVPELQVGIRIDGILDKVLNVSGDRFWRRLLGVPRPSSPRPFQSLPLVYERAYGGMGRQGWEPRNPVGIGRGDAATESEIANIEYPKHRVISPSTVVPPAGLGFIARQWQPRLGWAGTFDQAWKAHQFPLLPHDFDTRFHLSAPRDQQLRVLRGGEWVELLNLTPDACWRFRMPVLAIPVWLSYPEGLLETRLHVDTVLIEPDQRRVVLKARLKISIERNRSPLEEVVVGCPSRGWLRARSVGKRYLGPGLRDGASRQAPGAPA